MIPTEYERPTHADTDRQPSRKGRFWREYGYLLSGLPIGTAAFAIVIAGLSFGAGTLVIVAGIPVLAGTHQMARVFARGERRRVEAATGRALPPHHYTVPKAVPPSGWLAALRDPQSWRDSVHALVAFPVRVVTFCVAVTWTVGGVGELAYGAWSWSIPRDDGKAGLLDLMFGISSRGADIAFNTGIGVALVATAIPVVRGLTAVQAGLARALLTNEAAALRARTRQLADGRRSAVAAEAQTLRRLERDLHDGPQQRLVRLNMDLEAVARRLDAEQPAQARRLVDGMIEQSHEALAELRALSRGIAPPVLADRGLRAALTQAAARSPIPVLLTLGIGEGQRFAAAVENTAYFVVTEALTNTAKHSGAGRCSVDVDADQTSLRVRVEDDGRGGAHLGKGHGLAGLADRVTAVDGTLDVVSPVGGPTVVYAVVPLTGVGGL
ncbi:sensor histidine kinase [Yinghuangia seranimata]|uniref:sensor histidine kinase n=1 Tax=Yinghuangia seranimata TaxID=408067 RepID=UPI00248C1823|nr:sensor histidine kinase [Yinghuangia seranimata]MDI2130709.1 sensor domain-containing protein [Yinghuangia seranimata]